MDVVLNITAPIFLLILVGFAAARYGFIPLNALAGLSRFVLYLALPSLIFVKLSAMDFWQVFHPDYILVYALGGLGTFLVTMLLGWKLIKADLVTAGVFGVGATMSNSAFIGFPVLLQFFDEPMTQAFVMALMVENLILLPVCLIFIETMLGQQRQQQGANSKSLGWVVIKRITTNPLLIALTAGMCFSILSLPVPEFAQRGLSLLADGAAPTALVVIGGSLVGVSIRGHLSAIALVAVGKLILFPVLVMLLLMFTPEMNPALKVSVLVFAAMPMFSSYPIVCGEYGQRSFCASTLLVTTVLSFLTLSILLRFLATN